jgi:hypothetical protein
VGPRNLLDGCGKDMNGREHIGDLRVVGRIILK